MTLNTEYVRSKFEMLFKHSLDYIFVHDFKGNFIDANDRALSMLGFSREELPNISFKDLVDNDQMEIALGHIKHFLKYGGQVSPAEWKIKTRHGIYRDVLTYGVPIKIGDEYKGILGIAKDITEQKRALDDAIKSGQELTKVTQELVKEVEERTLEVKTSEERFQKIYEAVPDIFFLVSSDSTIIDFKGKEEDLFIPPDQLIGQKMSAILPPDLAQLSLDSIKECIETQKVVIIKYSLMIDDKIRDFEARQIFYDTDRVAIFIRNLN